MQYVCVKPATLRLRSSVLLLDAIDRCSKDSLFPYLVSSARDRTQVPAKSAAAATSEEDDVEISVLLPVRTLFSMARKERVVCAANPTWGKRRIASTGTRSKEYHICHCLGTRVRKYRVDFHPTPIFLRRFLVRPRCAEIITRAHRESHNARLIISPKSEATTGRSETSLQSSSDPLASQRPGERGVSVRVVLP